MKKLKVKMINIFIGISIIGISGKYIYNNFSNDIDDLKYRLTYISVEGNIQEEKQKEAIDEALKGIKVDEINFKMMELDENKNVVIKESEYNKLAEKLNTEKVTLKNNEAMIIPSYDGIKNYKYLKEQKNIKQYNLRDKKLNILGVVDKKILVAGLYKHQFIINDELYDELSYVSNGLNVSGYNFKPNKKIEQRISPLFEDKLFDRSNNRLFYLIGNHK